MSRSSRSSTVSGRSYRSSSTLSGLTTDYDFAAAYGEPALSDSSSDEQIARAISESKRTALLDTQLRPSSLSRSSSWTLVGHEPGSRPTSEYRDASLRAPSRVPSNSQTPTPRYAADEVIARNLARSWQVASVQSDIISNPGYTRPAGPPSVVRSSSPSPSAFTIASSSSSAYTSYHSPTGPLSPLHLPTRSFSSHTSSSISRAPSIRSISSVSSAQSGMSGFSNRSASSVASGRSGLSVSTNASASSRISLASIISSVARSSRHAPLETAARTLRASLPPSLTRSSSSVSAKSLTPRSLSRAGSVRSVSTTASRLSARGIPLDDKAALARLHALATNPMPCANPGCGSLIPATTLDNIVFPTVVLTDMSPPRSLFAALHARCPACTQSHCRGCGQPTGCDLNCGNPYASSAHAHTLRPNANSLASPASPRTHYDALYHPPPCPVPTHCPAVRALGALASLIVFDRAHMGIHQPGRASDKPLLAPLHALAFFLAPPARPTSPHNSGTGLLLLSEEDGQEGDDGPLEADAALPVLVRLSHVPAYAATLLRGEADVARWIDRAPAYGAVLRVLRALGDAGCRSVLLRPVLVHGGAAVEAWLQRGEVVGGLVGGGGEGGETLRGLIRRQESARAALLRLAGALGFGPTLQQAHALCDGLLYLLLQDVLGDDEGL